MIKSLVPLADNVQRIRYLPSEVFLSEDKLARARKLDENIQPRDRAPRESKVLLFSGAQDNQYSYDAVFNDRPNGAFTRFAIDALNDLPNTASYADWRQRVRQSLPNAQWPQTPDLYGNVAQYAWRVFNGANRTGNFTSADFDARLAKAQPGNGWTSAM